MRCDGQRPIVVDKSDNEQVVAAIQFKSGAQSYWNNQAAQGPNGENITFDVNISIVDSSSADPTLDAILVFSGSGSSAIGMTLDFSGKESLPDVGELYTDDRNNATSTGGMPGIGAHETGHLMGLRDLYLRGETVAYDPSPSVDIMRHSQMTSGAGSAAWVLNPKNGNTVVHKPAP